MRVLQIEIHELTDKLNRANELLSAAQQQCTDIAKRLTDLVRLPEQETSETLNHLARATEQQGAVLQTAREQGKGPGLQKKLEQACELDREQLRVVERLRETTGDNQATKSALEYYADLQRQQRQLLTQEVGKFEGQGLRPLLDEVLALSEQQEMILRELIIRRKSDEGARAPAG